MRQIVAELNRVVSTIVREIKRCLSFGLTIYLADYKDKNKANQRKGLLQTPKQTVANGEIFTQTKIQFRADFSLPVVKKGIKISYQAIDN